ALRPHHSSSACTPVGSALKKRAIRRSEERDRTWLKQDFLKNELVQCTDDKTPEWEHVGRCRSGKANGLSRRTVDSLGDALADTVHSFANLFVRCSVERAKPVPELDYLLTPTRSEKPLHVDRSLSGFRVGKVRKLKDACQPLLLAIRVDL